MRSLSQILAFDRCSHGGSTACGIPVERLRWILFWWVLCGLVQVAVAEPLFDAHEPLELVIQAPFHKLTHDRVGESEYHPGVLRYQDAAAGEVVVSLDVRARGKTRRRKDICGFPPLRLRFDENEVSSTLFQGQASLKLVTHCRDRDSYDQLVVQEYLAYRVYNLVTNYSHRVRLAEITYVQCSGQPVTTRRGIFLEHWRAVAARNNVVPADVDGGINIEMLSRRDANRVAVFQYLIGNQDYSMLWPESNDNCCHNAKPLFADGWVIPLPYDFDFAGIVDAPYAVPKPPNRSVRNRRYEGLCLTQPKLATDLKQFREQREAIYTLYREQSGIDARNRAATLEYLDDFYAVINNPAEVERRLVRNCKED